VDAAGEVDEFRTARPIAGWRVVAVAFWMALFAWALGFYSLSLYVYHLSDSGGWPVALLSAATTGYFLLGALAIPAVERLAARHGRRRVAIAGTVLFSGAVAALPQAPHAAVLVALYAAMALGWAATSGTAVSAVIGAWFERRRGLALNIALTGASASGFVAVPAIAASVSALGPSAGLALSAAVLGTITVVAIATNLPEPDRRAAPAAAPGAGAAPAGAAGERARLARIVALFSIGWLAQVAFLSQQVPLLVSKVGLAQATAAVGLTTAASLAGRLALSIVMDRIDHRLATAGSYAVQALGMALLLATDAPAAVLAGCVLFGLSVGNLITLPAIFAQREFPAARYGEVVARIWSIGQLTFAFGPMAAGALLAAAGGPAPTIAACLACQLAGAALCAGGRAPSTTART